MNHYLIAASVVVVGAAFQLVTTPDADAAERPNIILIMADDIGIECFGCYGSEQYKTPTLDRMAQKGMRFQHCYSQPLCTPSRVKIMTGLSNVRNYSGFSILNRSERTLGRYFQDAGYETLVAGKWQLYGAEHYPQRFQAKGSLPVDAGFDHSCLWQVDRLGSRYWGPLLSVDGENKEFGETRYGPDVVNEYVTDFLEKRRDKEKPFFIYYPMILVHSPFPVTPHSQDAKRKDKQKNFEDMVAYMDHLVGRVVRKTEQLGLADSTLILFTGDNGTHKTIRSKLKGRIVRGGKGLTTDAGTREPLIAYWPKTVREGMVNENLIDFTDFLPTLLETAGANPPRPTDGVSFHHQLLGQPGPVRKTVFCYYNPRPERTKPTRFVRDKVWKLYGDGRLYNVQRDPEETSNVAVGQPDSEAQAARKRLTAALNAMPAKGQSLLEFQSR